MSNKEHICVYPNQCQFPLCNCDQPQKVRTYGFTANGFYARTGSTSPYGELYGKARHVKFEPSKPVVSNELNDRIEARAEKFSNTTDRTPPTPPSGGPTETKPVDLNRPRYVYYVGGTGTWPSSTHVKFVETEFFKNYPHERDAATWIFIGTSGETRIERLS